MSFEYRHFQVSWEIVSSRNMFLWPKIEYMWLIYCPHVKETQKYYTANELGPRDLPNSPGTIDNCLFYKALCSSSPRSTSEDNAWRPWLPGTRGQAGRTNIADGKGELTMMDHLLPMTPRQQCSYQRWGWYVVGTIRPSGRKMFTEKTLNCYYMCWNSRERHQKYST